MSQFPYKAWRLMPSGQVLPVEVTGAAYYSRGWLIIAGRGVRSSQIHPTREAAIDAGLSKCQQRQARIDQMLANLTKFRVTVLRAQEDQP